MLVPIPSGKEGEKAWTAFLLTVMKKEGKQPTQKPTAKELLDQGVVELGLRSGRQISVQSQNNLATKIVSVSHEQSMKSMRQSGLLIEEK